MRRARAACGPCAAEGAPVTKELSKRSEVVLASVPTGVRVPHFSTRFVDLCTDRAPGLVAIVQLASGSTWNRRAVSKVPSPARASSAAWGVSATTMNQ